MVCTPLRYFLFEHRRMFGYGFAGLALARTTGRLTLVVDLPAAQPFPQYRALRKYPQQDHYSDKA
jgi:hypothetical protein